MDKKNILIAVLGLVSLSLIFIVFSKPENITRELDSDAAQPEETVTADDEITEKDADTDDATISDDSSPTVTPAPVATQPAPAPYTPPKAVETPKLKSITISSPSNLAEKIVVYETAVVSYKGGRFWPEKAYILEGGTVHFLNQSTDDEQMWIASDPHHDHGRYPLTSRDNCQGSDFDQCEFVDPGGSWRFTFDRFGTWGYHNDEDPSQTGDITVIRPEDY